MDRDERRLMERFGLTEKEFHELNSTIETCVSCGRAFSMTAHPQICKRCEPRSVEE